LAAEDNWSLIAGNKFNLHLTISDSPMAIKILADAELQVISLVFVVDGEVIDEGLTFMSLI